MLEYQVIIFLAITRVCRMKQTLNRKSKREKKKQILPQVYTLCGAPVLFTSIMC